MNVREEKVAEINDESRIMLRIHVTCVNSILDVGFTELKKQVRIPVSHN